MKLGKKIAREWDRIAVQLPWNRNANAMEVHIEPDALDRLGAVAYVREKKEKFLRIHLPTELMVMIRGIPFRADCNPFVAAISQGASALEHHYDTFQPKNLCEMHALPAMGRKGEDLTPFQVPWMRGTKSSLVYGEAGLGAEHGISHYGPVSPQKIEKEMVRLMGTYESIRKNGFNPIKYGDIKGYFLRRDDEYRFQIAGGKHRVAALAHMGVKSIPVRMREGWPRVIDRADYRNWPRVLEGEVDPEFALAVFDRYFTEGK